MKLDSKLIWRSINFQIFNVIACNILSKATEIYIRFYDPTQQCIEEYDIELIKSMKALSFIGHNIRNGNTVDAYKCMKYLIQSIKLYLWILKKIFFCNMLEFISLKLSVKLKTSNFNFLKLFIA